MSFLDLLSIYGPGLASQGQPINGASAPITGSQPPPLGPQPVKSNDPAERMGGQGGGFDWKALLAGGLGAVGAGLLGGKEGAGSFAANFANAKHQQNLQLREQEHQTQKAIADQAHKAWQELQGADWSVLPPELQHLSGKAAELNQKYITAIAKDSPGGIAISPKEAQEIISLSSVLRGATDKVGAFQKAETATNEAARPYASGLMSGTLEPPPSVEGMLDRGMDERQAAQAGGREMFQSAELARQQYDTPREIPGFGMGTPKDELAIRAQDQRAQAEKLRIIAADERQDKAIRARAEDAANRIDASFDRLGMQLSASSARQDKAIDATNARWEAMPVATIDEATGATVYRPRSEVVADGGRPPLPASAKAKSDFYKEALNKVREVKQLAQKFPDSYGGLGGWQGYLAKLRQKTIPLSSEESAFVQKAGRLSEDIIRAAEGAAVSADMYKALANIQPQMTNPNFLGDLDTFEQELSRQYQTTSGGRGLTPPPTLPGSKPKSDPLGILN
jgi:hypothetical protein